MIFFSQLLNRHIYDDRNESLGRCADIVVGNGAEGYPRIKGLITFAAKSSFFIPIEGVEVLSHSEITLKISDPRRAFIESLDDILLCRDLLDKQIFDVDSIRVVRVNDLQLMQVDGLFSLIAVDISAAAIFRRIGIPVVHSKFFVPKLLDWKNIDFAKESEGGLKLKMGYNKLIKLHPADIANLIENLSLHDSSKVMESFDADTAADVLAEVEPRYKDVLLEKLDAKDLSAMINKMSADEAADVFKDLSYFKKNQVLEHMQSSKADLLNHLASYEHDNAGGLMTTDYFHLDSDLTVSDALKEIQKKTDEHRTIYHVYIVNKENTLVGVISIRRFLFAKKTEKLSGLMAKVIGAVTPLSRVEKIAKVMTKYNLMSVPVVDEHKKLLGIVTVDDIMRVLIPHA
jgi:magnesium transporter